MGWLGTDAAIPDVEQLKVRWFADKVAELHLTFKKTEYALTALAASLVHMPLHCVPLGEDSFKITNLAIPRAGPGEHLRKLPATAARPGTDTTKPGTYLRTRATKNGTLFIASASEKAYNNWLDTVVQTLEAKLLTGSWAKVAGGGNDNESELKAQRGAVEKLEGACNKSFSDNVAATKEVGKKVEVVNQSVIDLTEETKQYHEIHTGISEDILKSFGNANRALAKLLTDKATPEKASRATPRGQDQKEIGNW
ncbi:hypothetical protein CYMTET_52016 [Cymbomonas tetramitiformis]|uniref:PH domain-containing protein n=1 Tax=Cymbomonas tetramitiformis TaxID=36881 RepID=A0AAE0ERR9_9CHLO|nr:hypothetical protein CYMTET_52016 [Cymbomonas tetramitiformis]